MEKQQKKPKLTYRFKEKSPDEITEIWIMGAGGIGFYLTTILAREPAGRRIVVFDDDNFIGGHGHERLPRVDDPNTKKVDFLNFFIAVGMGDNMVEVHKERLDVKTFRGKDLSNVLIIDATDMGTNSRRVIWAAGMKKGATFLRASYDGNGVVLVAWGLPLADNDASGYALVPTMAQSFTIAGLAAQVIHQFFKGHIINDLVLDLGMPEEENEGEAGEGDIANSSVGAEIPSDLLESEGDEEIAEETDSPGEE